MTDPLEQSIQWKDLDWVERSVREALESQQEFKGARVPVNDSTVRAIVEAVHLEMVPMTFAGLLRILDTWYPADVFTGSSEDVGVRCVVLARELAALRSQPVTDDGEDEWQYTEERAPKDCPVCGKPWRSQPLADDFRLICTHCPGDPEVGLSDCTARASGDGGVVLSCPQCGSDLATSSVGEARRDCDWHAGFEARMEVQEALDEEDEGPKWVKDIDYEGGGKMSRRRSQPVTEEMVARFRRSALGKARIPNRFIRAGLEAVLNQEGS